MRVCAGHKKIIIHNVKRWPLNCQRYIEYGFLVLADDFGRGVVWVVYHVAILKVADLGLKLLFKTFDLIPKFEPASPLPPLGFAGLVCAAFDFLDGWRAQADGAVWVGIRCYGYDGWQTATLAPAPYCIYPNYPKHIAHPYCDTPPRRTGRRKEENRPAPVRRRKMIKSATV